MKKSIPCYLSTYRKYWGITQEELAELLGFRSVDHLGCIERGVQRPTSKVIAACELLLDVPAIELFPAYFAEIEDVVFARLGEMNHEWKAVDDRRTLRKREFAALALQRAIKRNRNPRKQ